MPTEAEKLPIPIVDPISNSLKKEIEQLTRLALLNKQ